MSMKIAAYGIAKNEERNIESFLDTIKDFDEVVVLDTGSTDNTVALLRAAGVRVFESAFSDFDFSQARNESLRYVSPEMDWCFSLDMNEYLETDWRAKCEQLVVLYPQATRIEITRYDDTAGVVEHGSEDKLILHRREMYAWQYAVHEVLVLQEGYTECIVKSDIAITKKIQRSSAKEDLYATICLREYRKDMHPAFYLWFLIGYYFERREWRSMIEYGMRYIELTNTVRSDFRVHVYLRINRAFYECGEGKQGLGYGMLGFSEALFFPTDDVLQQAVNHLLSYAVSMHDDALLVYMMSFVAQPSQELMNMKKLALERLM